MPDQPSDPIAAAVERVCEKFYGNPQTLINIYLDGRKEVVPVEPHAGWTCAKCNHTLLYHWLRALREQLAVAEMCDVCGGTGTAEGGAPCICGGSGHIQDALDGIRKQLAESERERNLFENLFKHAEDENVKLEQANTRLREALEKYGAHDVDVCVSTFRAGAPCDCGLAAALARTQPEETSDG